MAVSLNSPREVLREEFRNSTYKKPEPVDHTKLPLLSCEKVSLINKSYFPEEQK